MIAHDNAIARTRPLVVLDIETVPESLSDNQVGFPKPCFCRIVAASLLEAKYQSGFEIVGLGTVGAPGSSESQILRKLIRYIEQKKPRLVTFNGRGFDLPVIRYRALKHGLEAPWLARGLNRWDNYNHRYNTEWHLDLMDALSGFGASKFCSLSEICRLLRLPGKLGVDGSQVKTLVENGQIERVRDYCEIDVLNTYLVFLRYVLYSGELSRDDYKASVATLASYLGKEARKRPHLSRYLDQCRLTAAHGK